MQTNLRTDDAPVLSLVRNSWFPSEVIAARMESFDKTDLKDSRKKSSHHEGAVTDDQPLLCKHC